MASISWQKYLNAVVTLIRGGKARQPLVIIQSDDTSSSRSMAVAIALELGGPRGLPICALRGKDHTSNLSLLTEGFCVDRPVLIYVEDFHQVPPVDQRDYAHLVSEFPFQASLPTGSVVVLQATEAGAAEIEAGTRDRGFWIRF